MAGINVMAIGNSDAARKVFKVSFACVFYCKENNRNYFRSAFSPLVRSHQVATKCSISQNRSQLVFSTLMAV